MDYGVIDYHTDNSNKRIDEILLERKSKQIIMSQFYNGKINKDLKEIKLNKDHNKDLKNYYTNNLLLDDNHKVIKNNTIKTNNDSFFDHQLHHLKSKLPDLPKIPVDISSVNLDRFYPLMKDPQINSIEKFTRGGENTVLQTLDNFKC
jgi:hypothetical protein